MTGRNVHIYINQIVIRLDFYGSLSDFVNNAHLFFVVGEFDFVFRVHMVVFVKFSRLVPLWRLSRGWYGFYIERQEPAFQRLAEIQLVQFRETLAECPCFRCQSGSLPRPTFYRATSAFLVLFTGCPV